jgi:hypothetical protein
MRHANTSSSCIAVTLHLLYSCSGCWTCMLLLMIAMILALTFRCIAAAV